MRSTDLKYRGYGDAKPLDFLKSTVPLGKHIVTNPPYGTHGLGDAFVRRALKHCQQTGGSVAMLLNLRSLCNPKRSWKFRKTPPNAIYLIDELTCWPEGKPQAWSSRIAQQQYYWAVWHPRKRGEKIVPKVWWLSPSEFKQP